MAEVAVDKEFIAALMLWHRNKMLTYNTKQQKGKQLFPTYRQSLQMLST